MSCDAACTHLSALFYTQSFVPAADDHHLLTGRFGVPTADHRRKTRQQCERSKGSKAPSSHVAISPHFQRVVAYLRPGLQGDERATRCGVYMPLQAIALIYIDVHLLDDDAGCGRAGLLGKRTWTTGTEGRPHHRLAVSTLCCGKGRPPRVLQCSKVCYMLRAAYCITLPCSQALRVLTAACLSRPPSHILVVPRSSWERCSAVRRLLRIFHHSVARATHSCMASTCWWLMRHQQT